MGGTKIAIPRSHSNTLPTLGPCPRSHPSPMKKLQVLVLAVAAVAAGLYFRRGSDGAAIRNDSVAFDLANLFVEVEEGTLGFQRALLQGDQDGLRLSLTEDASSQVPTPRQRWSPAPPVARTSP